MKFFLYSFTFHAALGWTLWGALGVETSAPVRTQSAGRASMMVETSADAKPLHAKANEAKANQRASASPSAASSSSAGSAAAAHGTAPQAYALEVRSRVLSALNDSWEEARKKGLSGRVILKLVLDEEGRTRKTEIVQSSGFALLDVLAADAARTAGPFPEPGPQLKKLGTFGVVVPIEFGSKVQ